MRGNDRAVVNVFAVNEAEAQAKAVKVFENQGQKAMALGVDEGRTNGALNEGTLDERRTCEEL